MKILSEIEDEDLRKLYTRKPPEGSKTNPFFHYALFVEMAAKACADDQKLLDELLLLARTGRKLLDLLSETLFDNCALFEFDVCFVELLLLDLLAIIITTVMLVLVFLTLYRLFLLLLLLLLDAAFPEVR